MKTPSRNRNSTSLTDPVHFASNVLGSVLWRRKRDIMRAVATKPLVAVKACHASGKTYLAARFALWWRLRYPEGKVINTAPGWRQVRLMWDAPAWAMSCRSPATMATSQTPVNLRVETKRPVFAPAFFAHAGG